MILSLMTSTAAKLLFWLNFKLEVALNTLSDMIFGRVSSANQNLEAKVQRLAGACIRKPDYFEYKIKKAVFLQPFFYIRYYILLAATNQTALSLFDKFNDRNNLFQLPHVCF